MTLTAGVRWEYEAPITEQQARLVNLDVAPGFTAAQPVLASDPTGPLTGRDVSSSLIQPDKRGIQPRLGLAWRPIAGSSLVVRAGYGIYRNTYVYQSIAMLLAQQPPLSTSFSVGAARPIRSRSPTASSLPQRVSRQHVRRRSGLPRRLSQNWQASVQRDLPASLTVNATYLGTKGSNLMQEFLPNTYPRGAVNPCPTCPAGFVYLTSSGSSSRHAGQFQLRRRLRNGLTATVQYTLAKADDDAGAFTGRELWAARRSRRTGSTSTPSGDRRTSISATRSRRSFSTRPASASRAAGCVDGWRGALFKNWTLTGQLTAGSGLPLTPVLSVAGPGTGVTGTIRGDR